MVGSICLGRWSGEVLLLFDVVGFVIHVMFSKTTVLGDLDRQIYYLREEPRYDSNLHRESKHQCSVHTQTCSASLMQTMSNLKFSRVEMPKEI